jgi:hypothetical protein
VARLHEEAENLSLRILDDNRQFHRRPVARGRSRRCCRQRYPA